MRERHLRLVRENEVTLAEWERELLDPAYGEMRVRERAERERLIEGDDA